MKEKIIVMQKDDRIYIRSVDIRKLKPLLKLAQIKVYKTSEGAHTGAPKYYINVTHGFKLIQTLKNDYSVMFL